MPGEDIKKNGVIYCVMGKEVGSNKKRHATIVLIKEGMIADTLGYYGVPSTTTNPIIRFIKKLLNIRYDLRDNHGVFKKEAFYVFDLGYRLYGKFFSLSNEKCDLLAKRMELRRQDQDKAIDEIAKEYHLIPKSPEKTRNSPYEDYSHFIFKRENEKAIAEGRPSRLRPFDLDIKPYNNKSNNCKIQALDILDGILKPDEITQIAGWNRGVPLYSGQLDWMIFKGEGPLHLVKKKNDEEVYARHVKDSELHWKPYTQHEHIINIVEKLRRIERLIEEPDFVHLFRDKLLDEIRKHYECFANRDYSGGSIFGLFSRENQLLLEYRDNANSLLDCLYAAAIEEYEDDALDDNDPLDLPYLVVPKMSEEKKKVLCSIIGKAYMQVENPKIKMM